MSLPEPAPGRAAVKPAALIEDPDHTHGELLVEVDPGRRLNFNCAGTGSPTVILDAGIASEIVEWALVQPEITRHSDGRTGASFSDPVTPTGTSENFVDLPLVFSDDQTVYNTP